MTTTQEPVATTEEAANETQQPPERSENKEDENTTDGEKRSEAKKWAVAELERLETTLREEAELIEPQDPRDYSPYVFNNLEPYCDTNTPRKIIYGKLPDPLKQKFGTRSTATGLTDPWKNHSMDVDIPEKHEPNLSNWKPRECKKEIRKDAEGSTRLPKFPVFQMEPSEEFNKKDFTMADVSKIRQEVKTKLCSGAEKKMQTDYKRTQQDWYRMQLDKLHEVHKVNQKNLRLAYFAYLQNTPGSTKAIRELMKNYDQDESGKKAEKEETGEAGKEGEAAAEEGEAAAEGEATNAAPANATEQETDAPAEQAA